MHIDSYRTELKFLALSFVLGAVFLGPKLLLVNGIAPPWIPTAIVQQLSAEFGGKPAPQAPLKNDTAPAESPHPVSVLPSLKFEGILYEAQGESQIIVGGEILKAGDSVQGMKIKKIYRDYALLGKDEKDFRLSVEGLRPDDSPGTGQA